MQRADVTLLSVDLLWPRLTSDSANSSFRSRSLDGSILIKHPARSLRVRRVTFLSHTRRIYDNLVPMTSGFESLRPLTHQVVASYPIRVPRAKSLPAASVRFAVARDTLAVRLEVPVIKASIGTCTRLVTTCFAFATQLKRPSRRFASCLTRAQKNAARKQRSQSCCPNLVKTE